ncbi:MAG: L,D-transpeptidase, partial [Clostridia bacterium]|nr:L,D-transpeptidase [Clostridia bacterium]
MFRRLLSLLLMLCLLLPAAALAEDAYLLDAAVTAQSSPEITYFIPATGTVSISVLDGSGTVLVTILSPRTAIGGLHVLSPEPAPLLALGSGEYVLCMEYDGTRCTAVLTVSAAAPAVTEAPAASPEVLTPVTAAPVATAAPAPAVGKFITPAYESAVQVHHDACYWCTPMDIHDEAAVWAMLVAPITVVDVGQKEQVVLFAEPDTASQKLGVITGASQAVHVLGESQNGWTKVECYSSAFHDSAVKTWNKFMTGYIQSSKLKRVTPNQNYGIVIDKLTQRLYLFHDGALMTELEVSTGLYNEKQPYNETRSGEFLIISKTGDFRSDNLICGMALRFNSGDLLHEVPHVLNADGTKNYKTCEAKLGTRASHGCIRVQRLKNPDGINMTWIWNNIKVGTKLVIWEDYQGRQMEIPAADTQLFYNPKGGTSYHSVANCNGVKNQYLPLTAFNYSELDTGSFAKLTPCNYCIPPMRRGEIESINAIHLTTSPGLIPQ